MANDIEISDTVIVSADCDAYRIAAIVDSDFTDDVAVNRVARQPEDGKLKSSWEDKIFTGIVMIRPTESDAKPIKLDFVRQNEKCLKFMLFLCKTEEDRQSLLSSGFTLCGDYLCWKYHDQREVHTLNMESIHEISETNLNKTSLLDAFNPFSSFMPLGNVSRKMTKMFSKDSVRNSSALQIDLADDKFARIVEAPASTKAKKSVSFPEAVADMDSDDDDFKRAPAPPKGLSIQVDEGDDDFRRAPESSPINAEVKMGSLARRSRLAVPNQMTTQDLETSIASVEEPD